MLLLLLPPRGLCASEHHGLSRQGLWRPELPTCWPASVDSHELTCCFTAAAAAPGRLLPPPECAANGTSSQVSPSSSPIYQALRTYQAGGRGSLARNRQELPPATPPPACSPTCKWGTCVKVGN